MISRPKPALSTQKANRKNRPTIPDQSELTITRNQSKKSSHDTTTHKDHCIADEVQTIKMALTFGTLLSSQRTDAHHHEPLSPLRGNLTNTTRHTQQSQNQPHQQPAPTSQAADTTANLNQPGLARPAPTLGLRSPCRKNINPTPNHRQIRGGGHMNPRKHRHFEALTGEIVGHLALVTWGTFSSESDGVNE